MSVSRTSPQRASSARQRNTQSFSTSRELGQPHRASTAEIRSTNTPIRVLIVDDSAIIRLSLNRYLKEIPDIQIIGQASNGVEALEQAKTLHPDVITLDVEMPRMNGLETLRHLMSTQPTPVVMLSSLTGDGTETTIKALELGAVDFVLKPAPGVKMEETIQELAKKIRAASKARVRRLQDSSANRIQAGALGSEASTPEQPLRPSDSLLMIASSTGGPSTLVALLSSLPAGLPLGGVIVQHMPGGFTKSLSERLNRVCSYRVKEAEPGDKLRQGLFLVAPGGYHMTFDRTGSVRLNQGATVNGVRPAADVTMRSLAAIYGDRVLAVVLTGMGSDGLEGAKTIASLGGTILAQNEESSVVYGMPRAVIEAGLVKATGSPEELSALIQLEIKGKHDNAE